MENRKELCLCRSSEELRLIATWLTWHHKSCLLLQPAKLLRDMLTLWSVLLLTGMNVLYNFCWDYVELLKITTSLLSNNFRLSERKRWKLLRYRIECSAMVHWGSFQCQVFHLAQMKNINKKQRKQQAENCRQCKQYGEIIEWVRCETARPFGIPRGESKCGGKAMC